MVSKIKKFLNVYRILKKAHFNTKIEVINLNANDICNSKCIMCNIWKNKKDNDFDPDQLKKLLSDPLYSNVTHVGITGGEPTLRSDLEMVFESVIYSLPKLRGVSIITNGIRQKDIINKILSINNLCLKNHVHFSVMVSLDGYKKVHNKNRGRENNFDSALSVHNYIKYQTEIPISIGCTITKNNVWNLDEFLFFIRNNKINARFRVAEFIERLYNSDLVTEIRNFTDDEKYQIQLFFHKVISTYEESETVKRTYLSIIEMLNGKKRQIGCPYKKNGIVINSKGELSYCAPKSPILGNGINNSSIQLYKKFNKIKSNINKTHCDDCIHDYHFHKTFKEYVVNFKIVFWKKFITIKYVKYVKILSSLVNKSEANKNRILIVGWYGTETIGDKAIFGGIIKQYLQKHGQRIKFTVASIYPIITRKTIKELNFENFINVIPVQSLEFIKCCKSALHVIMGGGPLMDINELAIPLIAFNIAKKNNIKTTIHGCGIGPLTKEIYINATKDIIKLSDRIYLRDTQSISYIKNRFNVENNVGLIDDPAKDYIINYSTYVKKENKDYIACFLRAWTYEYFNHVSIEEFNLIKQKFEKGLASLIKDQCKVLNTRKIKFFHMHNFVIGNDDRDFSYRFANFHFDKKFDIEIDNKLSTIEKVIQGMSNSKLNICMRFHSVLFAHTLQSEFIGIDYTNGGKIYNYLENKSLLSKLISIEQLTSIHEYSDY